MPSVLQELVSPFGSPRDPAAATALQELAASHPPLRPGAVRMAVRCLELPAARRWLDRLTATPEAARDALAGLGALGDPAGVPPLLEAITVPALARGAGEAFRLITGADLAREGLEGRPPEGFEAGPSDDPADPDVGLDPDEHLPWPDPDRLTAWWAARRDRFPSGVRHLLGKPIGREWLSEVLQVGRQRERAAAALELVLGHADQPLYEVRMPAWRQQTIRPARQAL
jgi:uncharacterized protein (TIGR02270 family)